MTAEPDPVAVAAILAQIAAARSRLAHRPAIIGLCGAQGSGKTTLAAALVERLALDGVTCATLSIDDLYLTRSQRVDLGRKVHPLLVTRGVPGTHDVRLGMRILASLAAGRTTRLPRFDKSIDDRAPVEQWFEVTPPLDVLIFEGWCVGALPEPAHALTAPVNALEEREDPEGIWRRYVNDALAGSYQDLFAAIDRLVLLAAPSFGVVMTWRRQQEQLLRARVPGRAGIMDDAAIARFIQHFERITRHILRAMPTHADLVLQLDEKRRIVRPDAPG